VRVTYRAAALRGDPLLASAPIDMVSGLAGLAAVCPEAWLGEEIIRRRASPPPAPVGDHGLPAFAPGHEAGLAWALERIARATGDPRFVVVAPAPPSPANPLDELEAALDAGRSAEATDAAARIVGRRAATGSWLPESSVADRLNPSGLPGSWRWRTRSCAWRRRPSCRRCAGSRADPHKSCAGPSGRVPYHSPWRRAWRSVERYIVTSAFPALRWSPA